MISTEAVFLTCLIDTKEEQYVVTTDIPGAFMHADIDEELYWQVSLAGQRNSSIHG